MRKRNEGRKLGLIVSGLELDVLHRMRLQKPSIGKKLGFKNYSVSVG